MQFQLRYVPLSAVLLAALFLSLARWNGRTWHNYRDQIPFLGGALGAIAMGKNTLLIDGYVGQQVVVLMDRRR